MTLAAVTLSPIHESIGERMPVNAVRPPGSYCSHPFPAEDIDSPSHRLKMIGIHAATVAAEVVDLKSAGDGPD